MGENLKRMRKARGWTQEHLAGLIDTDKRYISMMERGRGIGKAMMERLCAAFKVDEEAFTAELPDENREPAKEPMTAVELPKFIRLIVDELETMPEYEQLRLLAEIVERRMKKLEEQLAKQ